MLGFSIHKAVVFKTVWCWRKKDDYLQRTKKTLPTCAYVAWLATVPQSGTWNQRRTSSLGSAQVFACHLCPKRFHLVSVFHAPRLITVIILTSFITSHSFYWVLLVLVSRDRSSKPHPWLWGKKTVKANSRWQCGQQSCHCQGSRVRNHFTGMWKCMNVLVGCYKRFFVPAGVLSPLQPQIITWMLY